MPPPRRSISRVLKILQNWVSAIPTTRSVVQGPSPVTRPYPALPCPKMPGPQVGQTRAQGRGLRFWGPRPWAEPGAFGNVLFIISMMLYQKEKEKSIQYIFKPDFLVHQKHKIVNELY